MWSADRHLFWSTLIPLLVILALAALLIFLLSRGKTQETRHSSEPTTFVPVEEPDDSMAGTILSPEDRIITCTEQLDPETRRRLLRDAPDSLAMIVRVYERCTPAVQKELTELVHGEKLMEAYAAGLKDGAAMGVLAEAWRLFPDEQVLRSFVEMLASRDEAEQRSAVRLLSSLKEPQMLPMLVLALVRPDVFLPARVAEVFLSMPKEAAALLSYILPELDDKHKQSVLEIIAQTGVSYDPANVIACLDHSDLRIRSAAMQALGGGHITEALPQLLSAANDRNWQVRAAAAKALGMMGDSRAIPALQALTHDTEGWVGESARQALSGFYDS
ncbi:MAG: HEAT repeat domain-containing protein [Firmicutes bacterium]|nr:HEAT repeat domain-containing protein [Bacillota bacterium]